LIITEQSLVAKALDRFADVLRDTCLSGAQEKDVLLSALLDAELICSRATSLLDKVPYRID